MSQGAKLSHTFGYARISVGTEESVSVEAQRDRILEMFPSAQMVLEGASAVKSGDRPKFTALVSQIDSLLDKGDKVTLSAWKIDRLHRNGAEMNTLQLLMDKGLEIATVQDGSFRKEDFLHFSLKGLFAENEVRTLKIRQDARFQKMVERGEWFFGVPLGYRREGGYPQVDENMSQKIIEMFEEFIAFQGNLGEFIPQAQGILGIKRSRNAIYDIFRNRFYLGELEYRGQQYEGDYETFLLRELFESAQQKIDGNMKPKKKAHDFLFSNRLRTEHGHVLSGYYSKGRVYYRCTKGGLKINASEEELISGFDLYFQKQNLTPEGLRTIIKMLKKEKSIATDTTRQKMAQMRGEVVKIEDRLSRLIDIYMDGKLLQEDYEAKSQQLRDEKEILEERISQKDSTVTRFIDIAQKTFELVSTRFSSWSELNEYERRIFLTLTCSNATVKKVNGKIDLSVALYSGFYDLLSGSEYTSDPAWLLGLDSNQ